MTPENLQLTVVDRLATVTICRPEKLNALNRATLTELLRCMSELAGRSDVGAVILTGSGDRAFVAGADIEELAALGPAEALELARFGQRVMSAVEELGKPVVAAVNGFALGGGCELALAATLRVASEQAEFGLPEVTLGLIPGFAGTQRLARLIGQSRALEMILTGDRIPAAEALRIGLVNRVVEAKSLAAEAEKLTRRILSRAPLAVGYAQEAVQRGSECGRSEGMRFEAAMFALAFASEDMREGTRAFLEKRKPVFHGK